MATEGKPLQRRRTWTMIAMDLKAIRGMSVEDGKAVVVTESAGAGNADLEVRDLYFTATTAQFKMMTRLSGQNLQVLHLFDISRDPEEAFDLSDGPAICKEIDTLFAHLWRERGDVLMLRNAKPGWRRVSQ